MNYNLMPVKYFIDVVQTRGFISAAKKNYVSETAVSTAISKLEGELGQRLLVRSAGQFDLTPVGREFYKRAVEILTAYSEIWRHPDINPDRLLRIHFLQGLGSDAATFASGLPTEYQVSFDEETLDNSVSRLVKGYYDLLVGFELAFLNNAKVKVLPLHRISFDLLFNADQVAAADDLKTLAKQSSLYLQYWQSTGISDIQTAMLKTYRQDQWDYHQIEGVNSFAAACLSVNFKGGVTMVPENFQIPAGCERIYRYSPRHLKDAFLVVLALSSANSRDLERIATRTITKTYRS
ncbi:LysR family transcriptional regulator [Lactiplantibacillus plajomi]|uniref:LysR family transcriptional regulator n=1 Tax=Lactiplantibacillus plajomi TaxID=1457217 RepID=A0ABV6K5M9_9LACO|nr:LysR family transcriptional regulator [Lactiplantibacillus plajomi]